jgi:predicted phosphodiesterase
LSVVEELAATKKTARLAAENKSLRQHVEQLEASLLAARKSKVKIPAGKPPKTPKGAFYRVIVPDSHGAFIDEGACKAFLADLEWIKPSEVVMLGDHLDCGGWLAQHNTLGFVPEANYSYEDDSNACNQFIDEIQKRTGNVPTWYIEGNHEARVVKTILKQTCGNARDTEFMLGLFGPRAVLNIDKRGITWIGRDQHYGDCQRRGVLQLGKCLFTHGVATGPNAAHRTLSQFKTNVCFGHTHRVATAMQESAYEPSLAAWSFGCLCRRVPLYYDTRPTDWAHGYGLQIVDTTGRFITIQVPIIDGRSLLHPWQLRAA